MRVLQDFADVHAADPIGDKYQDISWIQLNKLFDRKNIH